MSRLNAWGRDRNAVPPGYCPDCETEAPLHEEFCPVFDRFRDDLLLREESAS